MQTRIVVGAFVAFGTVDTKNRHELHILLQLQNSRRYKVLRFMNNFSIQCRYELDCASSIEGIYKP